MQKILLRPEKNSKKNASNVKENLPYVLLDFQKIENQAKNLADNIEIHKKELTDILLEYESYEVVEDEVARTLDLLKNLKENSDYFKLRIGEVATFLPRNQPLYTFSCFVVIPSLMASAVHFRIPHSMKSFFPKILDLLKINESFPNIIVSHKERLDFLKERSALLIDPKTQESRPVTDVIIFTGTSVHADKLRFLFDSKVLFIANGAGHNPIVISKDADLSKAIEAVLILQLYNQGQDCAAPNSVLIHESIATDFMHILRENIKNVKVGHYKDKSCRVGPISDPEDLVRIQNIFVENREWLDPSTPGIIKTNNSIVLPTIIYKPLIKGGNFSEIFAPIIFVQKYSDDKELKLYFENKHYAQNAMYVTLYGTSVYISSLIDRPISGKILHSKLTFIQNTHLHAPGVERGVQPYGGYGYKSSSLSIYGKIMPMPTLPQRDIYKWVAEPLLSKKNFKQTLQRFTKIQIKNVEKLLKLKPKNSNEERLPDAIPNDFYLDSKLIKKNKLRYIKIKEVDIYKLLKEPNIEYINSLNLIDVKLIISLKKLLNHKSKITVNEFRNLLYALPKKTKIVSGDLQKKFFEHIYKLLFNKKSGPQLAPFLLDAEKETIDRLLDVK